MTESLPIVAVLAALLAGGALVATAVVLWRTHSPGRPREAVLADLTRQHTDAAARLEAMIRMLGDRQSQLQHAVNERLDSVSHRLGDSLEKTTQHTVGEPAEAQRAARGHRQRAEEHHRARHAGQLAAKRARQQAAARRVRPGAHGNHRARRPAEELLRVPVYAFQQAAAGLRGVPARPASAGHRRQISARSGHRLSRRQDRRRTAPGGGAGARPTCSSTSPTSPRNISSRARPRIWR